MEDNKEKQQVVLMNDINDDEKPAVTFGEICHKIWKGKIPFLVTTGASALVILLCTHYLYSKPARTYTACVHYTFNGASSENYPDGSVFDYLNLVSYSTLNTVKSSDSSFSNIDVDKMVNKNAITVERTAVDYTTSTGVSATSYAADYLTVTAKASYFNSDTQATKFFTALFSVPQAKANSIYESFNYASNLNNSKTAAQYDMQISLLSSQYSVLIGTYQSLISSYGDALIVLSDSSTELLSSFMNDVAVYFNSGSKITDLQKIVNTKGYVKNYDAFLLEASSKVSAYENSIALNEATIEKLKKDFTDLHGTNTNIENSAIESKIAELESQNASYREAIDAINRQITNGSTAAPQTFTDLLSSYTTQLQTYTDVLSSNATKVYEANNTVSYDNPNVVGEYKGGLNIGAEIGISVIAGLLLGSVVGYIVGNYKEKKETMIKSEDIKTA